MDIMSFLEGINSAYGNNLESVILYGSSVGADFHKGFSDQNVIIVLKHLSAVELAKGSKVLQKWQKKNPAPIFFTQNIIKSSCDVFPIEFSDMIANRKVLYGNDPFAGLKIDPKNLRHQCEHELRSKLLALASQYALLSCEPKKVIEFILSSSSSVIAVFKGVLLLSNISVTRTKKGQIEQLMELTGANLSIFIEILDVRGGNGIWRKEEAAEKFEQYLTSIERVISFVDGM